MDIYTDNSTKVSVCCLMLQGRSCIILITIWFFAGSFRVSLFIDLGCPWDLGTGWRGAFGTFMISRLICQDSDWWRFSIRNGVMGNNKLDSIMGFIIQHRVWERVWVWVQAKTQARGRPEKDPILEEHEETYGLRGRLWDLAVRRGRLVGFRYKNILKTTKNFAILYLWYYW